MGTNFSIGGNDRHFNQCTLQGDRERHQTLSVYTRKAREAAPQTAKACGRSGILQGLCSTCDEVGGKVCDAAHDSQCHSFLAEGEGGQGKAGV